MAVAVPRASCSHPAPPVPSTQHCCAALSQVSCLVSPAPTAQVWPQAGHSWVGAVSPCTQDTFCTAGRAAQSPLPPCIPCSAPSSRLQHSWAEGSPGSTESQPHRGLVFLPCWVCSAGFSIAQTILRCPWPPSPLLTCVVLDPVVIWGCFLSLHLCARVTHPCDVTVTGCSACPSDHPVTCDIAVPGEMPTCQGLSRRVSEYSQHEKGL